MAAYLIVEHRSRTRLSSKITEAGRANDRKAWRTLSDQRRDT